MYLYGGEMNINPPPPTLLGLDRMKYIVELAEQKEVNMALENTRQPEYLQYIFSNIQSNRLGFWMMLYY